MIGRQIAHFYVIRSLGSGGMGVVYEAQDTHLPRSVALKVLKPSLAKDVDAVRRFKREARLASSLNHPNICTILDVAEADGQSFIAMELLQGRSLRDRLAAGPMALDEILTLAVQAADALAAAHDQGIMHRDITPRNIFITSGGLVKLLDFGLAKHFASSDDAEDVTDDLTQPGTVAGTVHYMAPERFVEGASLDHRCDLFSLGSVLYQMATGARPFEGKSKDDVIALILAQPHIPLRRLAPQHPAGLERIIDTLLAKKPQDRYETAWLLRAELAELRLQSSGGAQAPARKPVAQQSLAVLPFHMIGVAEACTALLREGLVEDISALLSEIPGLRVAPRTSTRQLDRESAREVGARLNVRMLLEGSVQQADGRIRVIANVVNAADERAVLPAIRVDHPGGDLLSLQDEVAHEIARRVSAALTDTREKPPTEDAEALHAYKRGQHYWRSRSAGGWRQAIEHFQQAVERDRDFTLAHVALASAYEFLGFYSLMKPNLAFSVALQSAERALELDDACAMAHVELALIRFGGHWDWEGSEEAFRRALELDPANAIAHVCYGWLLMLLGREDAAIAQAKAGHELAPGSRFVACGRAQTLYLARRYDEAIELCNECLAGDADYAFAVALRGQCYELTGRFREAVTDLEHAATLTQRAPFYVGMLGHCYGQAGMRLQAVKLLRELDRQSRETYVPPQCYVFIYAGLGERFKALQHQEDAYQDGASPFNYLVPSIRELYALDPHHKKRLEQMRLIV